MVIVFLKTNLFKLLKLPLLLAIDIHIYIHIYNV